MTLGFGVGVLLKYLIGVGVLLKYLIGVGVLLKYLIGVVSINERGGRAAPPSFVGVIYILE